MPPLLRTIERHLERTGLTPTRFGRESIGDPRLIDDLKNGREPRARTAARVMAFIAAREGRGS